MSLRTFHIVFIGASALLAFGSAVYAIEVAEGALRILWALVAVGCGVALLVYGRRFIRKMNDIGLY